MRRFDIQDELGRGATGIVYRAFDHEARTSVALKKLWPDVSHPQDEMGIARAVTHPNVCRVHDVHREGGVTYLSSELLEGETLNALLRRESFLTLPRVRQIAAQIMDGLEAAHKLGIIHRDLSPKNIFICENGTVKILDFGIAVVSGRDDVTRTDCSGSVGYTAPEQQRGHDPTPLVDIYALGRILHELLHKVSKPPVSLQRVSDRCMKAIPQERFQSVGSLRMAWLAAQPAMTMAVVGGLTVACVVIALATSLLPLSQPVPSAVSIERPPPLVKKELPTVAIFFDGPAPIGVILSKAIVAAHKYRVVDRSGLDSELSEIQRTDKKDVNKNQPGHVVAADYFLFAGSRESMGRIDVYGRLVKTETTDVVVQDHVNGSPNDVIRLAEQLAARF